MVRVVKTTDELASALENDEITIVIEGELVDVVIRIRIPNILVWKLAFSAIVAAIVTTTVSGGTAALLAAPMGGVAVALLGFGVTIAAIRLGASAGDAGVLNKLRAYREVERGVGRLVLAR